MEFQLSYFKSRKMMLWKCCTQYANKFGKLSRGHRTGKSQFSFQSQRRAMPKDVHTTVQLHSFHMLARLCLKSFKLGFNSMWTKNFQMYKLDLEKSEEPDIKLPISLESQKKQVYSRKTSIFASFCTPRPNLSVTPAISWLPTFAFQSPLMKKTSFFSVSSRF